MDSTVQPWDSSRSSNAVRLLQRGAGEADTGIEKESKSDSETGKGRGPRLLCMLCGFPITTAGSRIQILGSHVHTFANPHGYVYRIGCYLNAPGCLVDQKETADFTWFEGYRWSIEVCGRCYTHMGWRFRSSRSVFHGLVQDHLVEEREPPGVD